MDTFSEAALDHGHVVLRNMAGPTRRPLQVFDAHDTDPANSARMSFSQTDSGRTIEEDLKLSRYLMKNRHSTPFEMVEVWMEMQIPIFVARQFVRHRTARRFEFDEIDEMNDPSLNEMSGRYVPFPDLFYVPMPSAVGTRSPTNKQGRIVDIGKEPTPAAAAWVEDVRSECVRSYERYRSDLDAGIPAELARLRLQPNIYTRWLWKQDLHNLLHCLSLRIDGHAQWEARQYGWAMYRLVQRVIPRTMALFDEIYMGAAPPA